jgi:hypothetical protein
MKRVMIAAALAGLAGMGHNLPPSMVSPTTQSPKQAVLPSRIVDEQRRNQKLKQKRRRVKRLQELHRYSRAERKTMKFGTGYKPGKLFKGHRV